MDLREIYTLPVNRAGHTQGPSMLDLCKRRGMLENCLPVHIHMFEDLNYRPLGRHVSGFAATDLSNLQHVLCVALVLHGLWQRLDISILPTDLDLELHKISHLKSAWPKRSVVRS